MMSAYIYVFEISDAIDSPDMKKRVWQKPEVSTVECRPEVTAYSGDLVRPLPVAPG